MMSKCTGSIRRLSSICKPVNTLKTKPHAGIYYKTRLKSYRPQYAIIKIAPAVPSIVGSLVE